MVALTATASLGLHKAIVPTVSAESEQLPAGQQVPPAEQQPALTLLQTGMPQSTTPTETKPTDTILRWTPTGVGDVQDVYDVRVAGDPTVDSVTGELTTDIKMNPNGITVAELDASTTLSEGIYYWQVRSCTPAAPTVCSEWSEVWTQHVDATAPLAPTAGPTSDIYSRTVSFAGVAEAASAVTVAVGDTMCVTNALEDGTWSCTFKDEFEYGDYTASVKAVDKAGNESPILQTDFGVKELFVAPIITQEELPVVLDVIPVDETPENRVFQQTDPAVIDVVNTAADKKITAKAAPVTPLSTDGGVIQSSENGWQIFGLPWFLWAGSGAGIAGAWWAFGAPFPRRITSILSL